jgi:sterol desaturase/sphingolipid hydroxylase (fatty acid hydroxylase superfamily)
MPDLVHLAIPAFFALMLFEAAVGAAQRRSLYVGADTAASLAMGLGNVVVNLGWKGAELAAFSAVYALSPLRGAGLEASPAAWGVLLVAYDFAYYWNHRLGHEVRLFWASHVVHHSSQQYNLSTALRQTWTPMTSIVFYLPLAFAGFPPAMILTVGAVNLLYQFWIHTQAIGRLGPLEWLLNTPSHHRVHHGSNVDYLDRNYGGILIVWDRWLGTFEPEAEPVRYGLTRNLETHHPVRIAFHEWAALARDVARARSWREAAARALRPPGWSPDGSTRTARELRRALVSPCAPPRRAPLPSRG